MKLWALSGLLFVSGFLLLEAKAPPKKGINGGFKCVACTYLFSLLDQLTFLHNETMSQSAKRFCSFLPDKGLVGTCKYFTEEFSSWLDHIHSTGATADTMCQSVGICSNKDGPYCYLFPKKIQTDLLQTLIKRRKYFPVVDVLAKAMIHLEEKEGKFDPFKFLCKISFIEKICFALKKYFNHTPVYDKDGDLYSQKDTFRGAYWRGKDCDDSNAKIHPGVKAINSDIHVDSNCNGIKGTDPQGRPYEDLFCKNITQRGFAVIGDSVAAHLHLPEDWFDAKKLSKDTFKNVLIEFENEFDWPQLSSATGFMNSSWNTIKDPTDSIYYRLWKRNRCIHRDFQNIGINGATSFTQLKFVKSLSRNQKTDHPLLVNYALVGNDVCGWHHDLLKHMTTPEEMFRNTMEILKYLDTILPKGSFIIITGLVDGRVLYDNMHKRIHPIGRTRNDVNYETFYDYFNCLNLSMCSGWLSSNKTRRDITQKRADQLTDVLQKISKDHNNFKNFRLHFLDKLFHKVIAYWEKNGGKAWQLIEPVDAFHNNQLGQALATKIIWDTVEKEFPEVFGEVNPNNEKIEKIFGNQGGY